MLRFVAVPNLIQLCCVSGVCLHSFAGCLLHIRCVTTIIAPVFRKVFGQVPDGCLLVLRSCGFAGCIIEAYSSLAVSCVPGRLLSTCIRS
jgi:hypothetical protein